MRLFSLVATVLLVGAISACEDKPAQPEAETATAVVATGEAHVHNLACGCSLGKSCSNMIEVDGNYVPLTGDVGLGPMEFCGKTGLQAEATGSMKDGTFVATKLKVVEKK